jgi:hypothetical protein
MRAGERGAEQNDARGKRKECAMKIMKITKMKSFPASLSILGSLLLLAVLIGAPGPATGKSEDDKDAKVTGVPTENNEDSAEGDEDSAENNEDGAENKAVPATQPTPETEDIPKHGIARNFELVGHNPLLDSDRGTFRDPAFDRYINPPLGIARGSNGDITAAGDCVYVG